jgi:phage terminase large subunit
MASALGARFLSYALVLGAGVAAFAWPSSKYREDPVLFFREVLGVEPWDKQIEIIEAIRDHRRVAVASGHKVSKSHTAAGVALWFFSSFPDARVVMTSTTARQVDQILWLEVKKMHARAGRCVACKKEDLARIARREPQGPVPCAHSALLDGGPVPILARTGIKSADFREVVGFTAREAEAVAGVSGNNLLYLADEASGIPDLIFEAIEGNRSGGGRIAMFSNPTKTEGEFFEAFHGKAAFYKTLRVSSEDSPNVKAGRVIIPGLCERDYVEEKKLEWGVDSPLYKIRIEGKFVLKEDGKILSAADITASEDRWADTPAEGRLIVGLDPAGDGSDGDDTAFAPRRGLKIFPVTAIRALTEEGILINLLAILKERRLATDREAPVVVLDEEGDIGTRVRRRLREYAEDHPEDFELRCVKASNGATRQPQDYVRVRDELWARVSYWIKREGGAVPPDTKLAKELHSPSWTYDIKKRAIATSKKELRKLLSGRSPDRADAVCLAVWERADVAGAPPPGLPPVASPDPEFAPLDPYSAGSTWGGSGSPA